MAGELALKTKAAIRFEAWRGAYRIPPGIDLLVNATSVGLYPDVSAMPAVDWSGASSHMLVCDAVPNPPETRLLREARRLGLPVLNGLSMLVHQGAIGFRMWTGREAPVSVMTEALRDAFEPE
jgi:shikimate dehydrogenase